MYLNPKLFSDALQVLIIVKSVLVYDIQNVCE